MKKSNNKISSSAGYSKGTKKYIPTPQEKDIILNYFLHNNFQDFNTWQQISRSKCQFEYNETKTNAFQCKVTLKWDDTSMPVFVGNGCSRNKRNAKKKALHKLVQNLIFFGYIGYGFKEAQFIKKLPKRRKQSSDEQSEMQGQVGDSTIIAWGSNEQYDKILSVITQKNFEKLMVIAIRQKNLYLFVKILRRLQKYEGSEEIDISVKSQDLEEKQWQNYSEIKLRDPFEEDLADILRYYQLQLPKPNQNHHHQQDQSQYKLDLPYQKLASSEGKISFQFFQPIEYTFIFRRNLLGREQGEVKSKKSEYFREYYKEIPMPKFEDEGTQPINYRVISKILNIILQFSFDYDLVVNLLSIFEREVTDCNLQVNENAENKAFYLRHLILTTVQFAYLLSKKVKSLNISIQGLINFEADGYLSFQPKEPEEFVALKISKKINISELQEMPQFASQQQILLVSKIDPNIRYIGQIIETWPAIRLKCISLDQENEKQKLPFTIYKLANAKLYNRLTKSITHFAKSKIELLLQNTFVINQQPTQPLFFILCQIISQWLALNETILIVSDNFNQLSIYLAQRGFKVAKITEKVEEKFLAKRSLVCCSSLGVCSDVIKNYAFTRVIIEGAQRVSETISTIAIDKGCKKLYLIGDCKLPEGIVLSKFAANRKMSSSLYSKVSQQAEEKYKFQSTSLQKQYFELSILKALNTLFYKGQLQTQFNFESPSIKGFPWPSQYERICFIHATNDSNHNKSMYDKVDLCCKIVCNVIKSGFITANQIACRVTQIKSKVLLTSSLYTIFKTYTDISVKPQLAEKMVDFITGSRFKQKNLCILIGESASLNTKHIAAALQEGRRGAIIISDFQKLSDKAEWHQISRWAKQKRIILSKKDYY